MKTFLNDKNGITSDDFEKILCGSIFLVSSLALIYKYMTKDYTDYNFIGFTLGSGGLFVTRKIASYIFKDKNRNQQN